MAGPSNQASTWDAGQPSYGVARNYFTLAFTGSLNWGFRHRLPTPEPIPISPTQADVISHPLGFHGDPSCKIPPRYPPVPHPGFPPDNPLKHPKSSRFEKPRVTCEPVDKYCPGGFCPVWLGYTLRLARYIVVDKLGVGRTSTVWLATDAQSPGSPFVALKVKTASLPQGHTRNEAGLLSHLANRSPHSASFVNSIRDHFKMQGPNGTHDCLVLEVLGPEVKRAKGSLTTIRDTDPPFHSRNGHRYSIYAARNILRSVITGLHMLHRDNTMHGDLRPNSLLFVLDDGVFDHWSESLLQGPLAEITSFAHLTRKDKKRDLWAPDHVVQNKNLERYANSAIKAGTVKLADLSSGCFLDQPPQQFTMLKSLRPPEVIVGEMIREDPKATPPDYNCAAIDMWNFGCILFEIVTGRQLFTISHDAKRNLPPRLTDDNHLVQMTMLLGGLPGYVRQHWGKEFLYFDRNGKFKNGCRPGGANAHKNVQGIEIVLTFANETMERIFDLLMVGKIPEWERDMIKDLLRKILNYDPAQRLTAEQALDHPWFELSRVNPQ